MAEQTTTNQPQATDVPQVNDSTTVQQQDGTTLPTTTTSDQLQPGNNDLNNIKTTNLQVKSGPPSANVKVSSSTLLSVILVATILIIAAALFIASLRVPKKDETKPTVAVGPEENGSLGKTKKKRFSRNKKSNV